MADLAEISKIFKPTQRLARSNSDCANNMGVPRGRAGRGGWRPGATALAPGTGVGGGPRPAHGHALAQPHTSDVSVRQPALDCAQPHQGSVAHIVLIVLKVAERCPHNQTLAARTNSNKYRS